VSLPNRTLITRLGDLPREHSAALVNGMHQVIVGGHLSATEGDAFASFSNASIAESMTQPS